MLTRLRGFKGLHRMVRTQQLRRAAGTTPSIEDLCHAMDLACVFYFRTVSSLERSAATTLMLRRYGRRAEMVIGLQVLPMDSHTWVEIDNRIVNDKPNLLEIYQILERC
jgi:hypothetical protein